MRWSGEFLAGHEKKIEVLVYDDEYVTSSAGQPVIVFAVRLLPRSLGAGSIIQGYSRAEKSVWSTPLGHTFEEVLLPVVQSGNAWTATITILPVADLEQVVVKWPSDCENRPFFGYEISVVEWSPLLNL